MTEAAHLAQIAEGILADGLGEWFASITKSTAGLTPQQAAHVPRERFNCIWAVVDHIAYWMGITLKRLKGENPKSDEKESWPLILDPSNGLAWERSRQALFDMNHEFAAYIRGLSDEDLAAPPAQGAPPRYMAIHGVLAHNAYHSCEVLSIRHMQGLWVEGV